MEHLYGRAQPNMDAKYDILRAAVMKIPDLENLSIYRGARSYDELRVVIEDFQMG